MSSTQAKKMVGQTTWQQEMRAKMARKANLILDLRMKLATARVQGDKVAVMAILLDLEALGYQGSN